MMRPMMIEPCFIRNTDTETSQEKTAFDIFSKRCAIFTCFRR